MSFNFSLYQSQSPFLKNYIFSVLGLRSSIPPHTLEAEKVCGILTVIL